MSTILLVDDEQEMLDLFTEVLELMDHRVLNARDGSEAVFFFVVAAGVASAKWGLCR